MSTTSGFHTHQSWGRTRRPKALKRDGAIASKEAASEVTTIAVGELNDDLNDATSGHNGYSTENQRFLHIQIENNGTDDTLKLYAYNYAFGSWSELYLPLGRPAQADTALEAVTVNDVYVEAKWTSISGKFMVTVPLHGIDRIAFVHDGTPDGTNFKVRAAGSTF